MIKRRVAVSVAVAIATTMMSWCFQTTTALASNSRPDCRSATAIFARGSGQDLNAKESRRFRDQLESRIGKSNLNFYELGTTAHGGHKYPAVTVGEWWKNANALGAKLTSGSGLRYGESVSGGILSGEESQRFIDDLWESLDRDDIFNKKISKREFTNYVQDVYTMIDECFEDIDFITFPYLLGAYGRHNVENSQAIKSLIDSYGSLLPKDILDDYRREIGFLQPDASGGELFSEVITLIKKVGCLITHGEVNSLVSTYSERDIHRVLRAMFNIALSHRQDIYLTHKFLAAGASIDFVFSRGGEAVPVEVKLASNGRLKHGIERQLVRYAGIIGVDRAIMIVVCQSDSDIRKIDRLRENLGVTFHVAIELVAIDARRKYPASRLN